MDKLVVSMYVHPWGRSIALLQRNKCCVKGTSLSARDGLGATSGPTLPPHVETDVLDPRPPTSAKAWIRSVFAARAVQVNRPIGVGPCPIPNRPHPSERQCGRERVPLGTLKTALQ